MIVVAFLMTSCNDDATSSLISNKDSTLSNRSSLPKIEFELETSTQILPLEGTLQDMCESDILLIQELPSKESHEYIFFEDKSPCINITRSEVTYDVLGEDKTGEDRYQYVSTISMCNGNNTVTTIDTVLTLGESIAQSFWQEIINSHAMTEEETDAELAEFYEGLVSSGAATVSADGFIVIATPLPDGGTYTVNVSMETYLIHSEVITNIQGEWTKKILHQYHCQSDQSYIPFVTVTVSKGVSTKCKTPYLLRTITEFKNYTKTNI